MSAPKPAADYGVRIERLCEALGHDTASETGRSFVTKAAAYAELVAAWSPRVDLTAATDPDELVDVLFADAVALTGERVAVPGERWVDVGSGVGAPGVPLALLDRGIAMTLVEPRAKRVAFLRTLLHRLDRLDVTIERSRSETLPPASFDVAVSRATFPPPDWLREGARLARRDVWVLSAGREAPKLEGWDIAKDRELVWPLTRKARKILCYRRSGGYTKSE